VFEAESCEAISINSPDLSLFQSLNGRMSAMQVNGWRSREILIQRYNAASGTYCMFPAVKIIDY
jgi:hypothetical protein